MFLILAALITILLCGIYIALHLNAGDFTTWIGIIMVIVSACGLLHYSIIGYSWFAAEYQARLINQEFGTEYTQEEVFWASDVIDEIRELQRNRIEVNGNVMGHGKDLDKEE